MAACSNASLLGNALTWSSPPKSRKSSRSMTADFLREIRVSTFFSNVLTLSIFYCFRCLQKHDNLSLQKYDTFTDFTTVLNTVDLIYQPNFEPAFERLGFGRLMQGTE